MPADNKALRPLRPAVFLDRDGTIIVECDYLADPDRVVLVPGATAAMRELAAHGFALVIVTNQSGIARGLYSEDDFLAVQKRVEDLLRAEGVEIDGLYYCPHHPDFSGPCDCRKPGPGMYRRAQRHLGIDLARSAFVGDRVKDVEPAIGFGGLGILVRTGYGEREETSLPSGGLVTHDLAGAARIIIGRQQIKDKG